MTQISTIFDMRLARSRAMRWNHHAAHVEALVEAIALRLLDRVDDISRDFSHTLNIGSHHSIMARHLRAHPKIKQLTDCDLLAPHADVVCDNEWLPFKPDSFDLALSLGVLYGVNDLVGTLIQLRHSLRPDGMLLIMLPGASTLQELRMSFAAAENALYGGSSPRVAPFVDIRDAATLLQRTGYELPVCDSEMVHILYPDVEALMADLRHAGYANHMVERVQTFSSRRLFSAMRDHYHSHFAAEGGKIKATLELVTLTGFKPR